VYSDKYIYIYTRWCTTDRRGMPSAWLALIAVTAVAATSAARGALYMVQLCNRATGLSHSLKGLWPYGCYEEGLSGLGELGLALATN